MAHSLSRAVTALTLAAGLAFAGQTVSAAPIQSHAPGSYPGNNSGLQLVAGHHMGGGHGFGGGFRGGHRGGHFGGGLAAGIAGGLILGGIAADDYYGGDDYYGYYGYSCRSLEYRCDRGSDWACHRLDVDPRC